MIRTMEQLEAALDAHTFDKWHRVTLAAIEAGNASDAGAFAKRLAGHCRETMADTLAFGDDPPLLADIRADRAQLRRAA